MPAPAENAVATTYQGTAFQSPLEARWAVFFDAIGIVWDYEAAFRDLDGLLVQPDFWLPQYCCFWEVRLTQKIDYDHFGTWAAIADTPVVVCNRLPHYCGALTPARLVVIGFPCAEPAPWLGPHPQMPNIALRQRIAEATGRTWVYSGSRIPGECPECGRSVLLWFDAGTNHVTCPVCGWDGFPAKLLASLGEAGDVAEAFIF